MYPQIMGISGSPIKNSNTDRLVQAVLAASGLKAEFVKLSRINVRPCIACLGCGFGESYPMSALPWVFGEDTAVTPEKFCRVEDQEVWGAGPGVGPGDSSEVVEL